MNPSNFCHLHTHDHLSTLDGLGTPTDFAKQAKNIGYKYLAITNHANIDSIIDFQKECGKNEIVPIIGCELFIVPNLEIKEKGEQRGHITVWVKNQDGYSNLLKMLSVANLYGFYYRPRIDFAYFLNYCEGLCVGTACTHSFLNIERGIDFLEDLIKKIPQDVYLEIMSHEFEDQIIHNKKCLELNKKYNIPLLMTHDAHYATDDGAKSHEVLLCLQTKSKMSDPNRWKFSIDGLYICHPDLIEERIRNQNIFTYIEYSKAMTNTLEIAKKCKDFKIHQKKISLPTPPRFIGKDEEEELRSICLKRLDKLFSGDIPQNYLDRFEYEYLVIKEKQFVRYFLIVYDIISYCRENSIMTGPRGSASGCLISYLLQIVDIDPIKWSLVFERFLNKGRTHYPDIDLDIEDKKRELVINRLKDLYGEQKVAGVSTFLKMEARSVIRDVSRAFEVPLQEVDKFAKGITDTIEEGIEKTQEGRFFAEKYPEVITHSKKLQKQVKSYGKHAAGIVLSSENLDSSSSVHLVERNKSYLVNFEKDDVEYCGLIKFDFLGLSTLTVLSETLNLIKENHKQNIDLYKINLNDKKIFNEINNGNTVGCFQISTYTLKNLISQMKVNSLNDLSDALALCRPGPLDSKMTEMYIKRKYGEKWVPKHAIFEEITKETYGICAYQEQIIFVFNRIAGLSLEIADEIRAAIGKKREKEAFLPYKKMFVEGCLANKTFNEQQALDFFEEILYHSRYSFNRSHAISYAFNSYFTCWLKYYYPTEFLCASLTYGSDGQKHDLIKEATRLNLKIVPPKVGTSDTRKWIAKKGCLYTPFIEIKGVGEKSLDKIESLNQQHKGFFKEKTEVKGKLKSILENVGAFTEETPIEVDQYFDFGETFTFKPEVKFKNLYKIIGNIEDYRLSDLLVGNFTNRCFVSELKGKTPFVQGIISCTECNLRKNTKKPTPPNIGLYNIAIIGETYWTFEGNNGDLFWKELKKYRFEKEDFYITNFLKCKAKQPTREQVRVCGEKWLKNELIGLNPRIILSLGNTGLKFFTSQDNGIFKFNGTTMWSEEYSAWICFSISPNLVLIDEENRGRFKEGIKNFVERMENIGGLR